MAKVNRRDQTDLYEHNNKQAMTNAIKKFLEAKRFNTVSPAVIKGKSGVEHIFDIVAYKGDIARNVTVIDVTIATGDTSEKLVIAMFTKIIDVLPDKAYLIAIPKITKNSKKLAKLYKIQIIEAKNQKEALEALEKTHMNQPVGIDM